MTDGETLTRSLLKDTTPSLSPIIHIPEIECLQDVPQDPKHHPEGNVLIHSLEVLDRAAELRNQIPEQDRLVYMLAAWLHDIGKWEKTFYRGKNKRRLTHWTKPQPKNTRIVSYGHDSAGVKLAEEILDRFYGVWSDCRIQRATKLVGYHMRPLLLKASKLKAFKKLRNEGGDLFLIGMLSWADKGERPDYWFERIKELNEKS